MILAMATPLKFETVEPQDHRIMFAPRPRLIDPPPPFCFSAWREGSPSHTSGEQMAGSVPNSQLAFERRQTALRPRGVSGL